MLPSKDIVELVATVVNTLYRKTMFQQWYFSDLIIPTPKRFSLSWVVAQAIIESHHKLVPKLFMVPSLSLSFHSFQGRFTEVSWTFAHSGYLKSHQSFRDGCPWSFNLVVPNPHANFAEETFFSQFWAFMPYISAFCLEKETHFSCLFLVFLLLLCCAYSHSDWPLS